MEASEMDKSVSNPKGPMTYDEPPDVGTFDSFEWTPTEVAALFEAVTAPDDRKYLIPEGINKYFNLMAIRLKFQKATGKVLDSPTIMRTLDMVGNVENLGKKMKCPFQNAQEDFVLSEMEFGEMMRIKTKVRKCKGCAPETDPSPTKITKIDTDPVSATEIIDFASMEENRYFLRSRTNRN